MQGHRFIRSQRQIVDNRVITISPPLRPLTDPAIVNPVSKYRRLLNYSGLRGRQKITAHLAAHKISLAKLIGVNTNIRRERSRRECCQENCYSLIKTDYSSLKIGISFYCMHCFLKVL